MSISSAREAGGGLVLLALEVEVLDLLGLLLEPVPRDERVVEVLLARAHAADVERDERPDGVARGVLVVGDEHVDARGDAKSSSERPGALRALLEQRLELLHVLGGEEHRDPAVGDLAGELHVVRPDRREVDRDLVLHRLDRQLQRLAGPVGQRQVDRLALVLEPLARERLADDLDVLARALDLLAEALARASPRRPAGRSTRCRAASARPTGCRSSRRSSRSSRRCGAGIWKIAEPSLIFDVMRREPAEDRRRVRAVRLRGPDRVVAQPLGLLDDLLLVLRVSPRPQ